jgi:hypothetical protein
MRIRTRINQVADRVLTIAKLRPRLDSQASFCATPAQRERFKESAGPDSVASAFFQSQGRPVDKWHHYLEIYERYLSRYKGQSAFFLEIGVLHGGSLDMWRRYFGDQITIVGIDIDGRCASRVDAPNIVRIGSQADRQFLRDLVTEFGRPDVVLDDGSHIASHQRTSFDELFDAVKDDGIYIIEDLHTSYWAGWDGGYRRKGTAVDMIKKMIDDVHVWYHKRPCTIAKGESIGAIHVYDSTVVIEKRKRDRPVKLFGGAA